MADAFLIKRPWVTEKSTDLSGRGKYVFIVKPSATKSEVKKAVNEIYKVDVVSVNVINKPAKKKRIGQLKGLQSGYKKAVVTLEQGQKIDMQ